MLLILLIGVVGWIVFSYNRHEKNMDTPCYKHSCRCISREKEDYIEELVYEKERLVYELEQREKERREEESLYKNFFYPGRTPIDFDSNVFIYLESTYDKELNDCILNRLDAICAIFQDFGFLFIYLPRWKPDRVLSYLINRDKEKQTNDILLSSINTVEYTRLLCDVLGIQHEEIDSGIFHLWGYIYDNEHCLLRNKIGATKFTFFPLKNITEDALEDFFKNYCLQVRNERCIYDGDGPETVLIEERYMRLRTLPPFLLYKSGVKKQDREMNKSLTFPRSEFPSYFSKYISYFETLRAVSEIAGNINKVSETLKDAGYFEVLLQRLDPEIQNDFRIRKVLLFPSLSKIQITNCFRILLLDYEIEIEMPPLQKTLYIFYLRHSEGVELERLSVYYDELLAIYKVLLNGENAQKLERNIRRLTDVADVVIKKCLCIKEAFLKVTNDFVARNYYIESKKDETQRKEQESISVPLKITLPRKLVLYPEEIKEIPIQHPEEDGKYLKPSQKSVTEEFLDLKCLFDDDSYPATKLIEKYTEFIKCHPKHYSAYFFRAVLYARIGKYQEAVIDNQILTRYDKWLWPEAHINKAEAFFFLEKYEDALVSVNRYFELVMNPVMRAYRIRAEIFNKLGRYEEEKEDFMHIMTSVKNII